MLPVPTLSLLFFLSKFTFCNTLPLEIFLSTGSPTGLPQHYLSPSCWDPNLIGQGLSSQVILICNQVWQLLVSVPGVHTGSHTPASSTPAHTRRLWVQFSCSVMSSSLWPHGLQLARLTCTSPTPGACSNSCPLSWWCHPTIHSLTRRL